MMISNCLHINLSHFVNFNKVMKKRIKISEVADYCMVSRTTVRRWIEGGKLRALTLPSGQYRIRTEDFKAFLKSCEPPQIKEDTFKSKSKRKEGT
jgi:excisionase family DNA binding protein